MNNSIICTHICSSYFDTIYIYTTGIFSDGHRVTTGSHHFGIGTCRYICSQDFSTNGMVENNIGSLCLCQ